jgi:hypothetical protein
MPPEETIWLNKITEWQKQYPDSVFKYIKIDNPLYNTDILIVVQKM